MLPKKYRLTRKDDFINVIKKGEFNRSVFISLKKTENELGYPRVGIVTGQKISKKAVVRNLIKRRIADAVGIFILKIARGIDLVILPTPGILDKKHSEIKEEIEKLFKKAKLL